MPGGQDIWHCRPRLYHIALGIPLHRQRLLFDMTSYRRVHPDTKPSAQHLRNKIKAIETIAHSPQDGPLTHLTPNYPLESREIDHPSHFIWPHPIGNGATRRKRGSCTRRCVRQALQAVSFVVPPIMTSLSLTFFVMVLYGTLRPVGCLVRWVVKLPGESPRRFTK